MSRDYPQVARDKTLEAKKFYHLLEVYYVPEYSPQHNPQYNSTLGAPFTSTPTQLLLLIMVNIIPPVLEYLKEHIRGWELLKESGTEVYVITTGIDSLLILGDNPGGEHVLFQLLDNVYYLVGQ